MTSDVITKLNCLNSQLENISVESGDLNSIRESTLTLREKYPNEIFIYNGVETRFVVKDMEFLIPDWSYAVCHNGRFTIPFAVCYSNPKTYISLFGSKEMHMISEPRATGIVAFEEEPVAGMLQVPAYDNWYVPSDSMEYLLLGILDKTGREAFLETPYYREMEKDWFRRFLVFDCVSHRDLFLCRLVIMDVTDEDDDYETGDYDDVVIVMDLKGLKFSEGGK